MNYDQKLREQLVEKIIGLVTEISIDPTKAVFHVAEISDALLIANAFFWSLTNHAETPRDQRKLVEGIAKQLRTYLKDAREQFLSEGITVHQVEEVPTFN